MTTDNGLKTTLSMEDEDSELLWQAAARAEALLVDLQERRPTGSDLAGLLGYAREVVLARISDEESNVLPALRQAPGEHPELDQLHEEHLRLRSDIDDLAAAAQQDEDPADLPTIVRRLIARLEGHLATEAAILTGSGYASADRDWARAGHWYCLTEGPVIEMDQLKPHEAQAAVLNRLGRMQPEEHLELHWAANPQPVWQRLQQRDPGGYSWQATESSTGSWSVDVSRRPSP
ncbi:MAG: hemerythrin domain-containing protein [Mycobacteriales bacterium]